MTERRTVEQGSSLPADDAGDANDAVDAVQPAGPAPATGRAWRPVVVLGVGTALCLVVWVALVRAAIGLGQQGREGDGAAWVLLVVCAVLAAGLLFAAIALVVRLVAALRDPAPAPRPRGGKRARR